MGHTDSVCMSDAGLPIPDGVERIDLSVIKGMPPFLDVLAAVHGELFVERATIARQMADRQPAFHAKVLTQIGALEAAQGNMIALDTVSHEAFKQHAGCCTAVVRADRRDYTLLQHHPSCRGDLPMNAR